MPTLHRLSAIGQQRDRVFRAFGAFPGAPPATYPGVEVTAVDLEADSPACLVAREPDELCYIYFTSGSTGQPKGIAGRLKAIDHFVRWEAQTVGAREGLRFSQLTNPVFDAFLRDVFTPLCTGGIVCVPADRATKLNPLRLLPWLRQSRVNVVHCVPSVLRTLLQIPVEDCQLPNLAHVLTSGEPLLPVDLQRWMPRFGSRARLTNLYGPSETTMVKFAYPVSAADGERRFVSIGKPIDGTRAIVVNEHGKVCGSDRRGLHPQSLRLGSNRPRVSHGRSRSHSRGRQLRVPRTTGSSGEDPGRARGTGGNRERAPARSRRTRRGRNRSRPHRRQQVVVRVRGAPGRLDDRGASGRRERRASRIHDAVDVRAV
ncbi:MAG: hypothetical protein DMF89_07270 [Acidobacteria bacterium]|nr:MAG: hypothetical protein DMF89_07270 [Acidobacteriota bacterium]